MREQGITARLALTDKICHLTDYDRLSAFRQLLLIGLLDVFERPFDRSSNRWERGQIFRGQNPSYLARNPSFCFVFRAIVATQGFDLGQDLIPLKAGALVNRVRNGRFQRRLPRNKQPITKDSSEFLNRVRIWISGSVDKGYHATGIRRVAHDNGK